MSAPTSIGRREFLARAGAGGAALALHAAATAAATSTATAPSDAAIAAPPVWRNAFADVPERFDPVRVPFRGRLPARLAGTLYRNGPARMHRGATHYGHWFDGDGMVHAYRIGGGALEHRARIVRTTRWVAEQQAGRFLWNGFGTAFADARAVSEPDDVNVANISVLPMGDELLALWEGGSAWRVDAKSLQTLGRKVWSPDTDGMPFSAHPRVDPDGTVWNFGYLPGSGKLALYRTGRDGRLAASGLIDAPNADMVHDFAVTARHLVFLLMPLAYDAETAASHAGAASDLADAAHANAGPVAFVDRYRWQPHRPSVLLTVDKDTLAVRHRIELPAFAVFHLGNAWESDDALHVQSMRVGDFPALMAAIRAAVGGRPHLAPPERAPVEIVADLRTGRAQVRELPIAMAEFPRYDPRFTGRPTRALFVATRTGAMPAGVFGLNAVARIDPDGDRVASFDYGPHALAEEHVFVPDPERGEGAGWLIGTRHDWVERATTLAVFDAQAIDAGPLAQATLPYALPPGLHGAFVADARG